MRCNYVFSQINPYIRYARYLNIAQNTIFDEVIPLDARLFYTFSGHGKIIVENTEFDMPTHSLIIINSGIPYKLITPEKKGNLYSHKFRLYT